MGRFVEGADRSQRSFLPECLEDWVDEDNPVHVIDAFVEALDLLALGFDGARPANTGRPAYHPAVLLKLYIYGYLNRVQSSRRLEREAGRNVELMWLLGRLVPDHKTIADFRKDYGRALRRVCARFVALCRQMGLLAGSTVVVDGSKFKAVNNRDRNFTHAKMARRVAQIEESITRYLRQLDSADRQEPSEAIATKVSRLKEKIGRLRQEMERLAALDGLMRQTPDQQISLTDPDSRSMATSGRGSGVVGYNVQVAVEDGCDPLPDEAPAQRRRRDGIARARLQPDPGDEHHWSARPDRGPHFLPGPPLDVVKRQRERVLDEAIDFELPGRGMDHRTIEVGDREELFVGRDPRIEALPDELVLDDLGNGVRRKLINPSDHLLPSATRQGIGAPGGVEGSQSGQGCAALDDEISALDIRHNSPPLALHRASDRLRSASHQPHCARTGAPRPRLHAVHLRKDIAEVEAMRLRSTLSS